MMNLIALLLVLTGTANIDATGYLHQEILIIRNYNNNNDGLKKVKDAVCAVFMIYYFPKNGFHYCRILSRNQMFTNCFKYITKFVF